MDAKTAKEYINTLNLVAQGIEEENGSGAERITVNGAGEITLFPNKGRRRNIGKLLLYTDGVIAYVKRVEEKHRFRKADAWGFNWRVIKSLPDDGIVRIIIGKKDIREIPVSTAKEHGFFMWFKGTGNERQFMVEDKHFKGGQ